MDCRLAAMAMVAAERATIAELRGQGVGEIMALAGDPALLKSAATFIKARGLDTTPQAYLRAMLEMQRDNWLEKRKGGNAPASTSTLNVPSAAVAAYRAKLNGGNNGQG